MLRIVGVVIACVVAGALVFAVFAAEPTPPMPEANAPTPTPSLPPSRGKTGAATVIASATACEEAITLPAGSSETEVRLRQLAWETTQRSRERERREARFGYYMTALEHAARAGIPADEVSRYAAQWVDDGLAYSGWGECMEGSR